MATQTTDLLKVLAGTASTDRRIRHSRFISYSTREDRFRKKKVDRTTAEQKGSDGIVLLERTTENVLENKTTIYGEYAAFTHSLEGCPRLLLTYILLYELNDRGTYKFNQQSVKRFIEYSRLLGAKEYTESTIRKANRTLVEKNVVQNVNRGVYMINPLVAGSNSHDERRRRIDEYSRKLMENGRDTTLNFLPVYEDTGL